MYRHISDQYSLSTSISTLFRANQSPTTGIAICLPYLYTVTRDRYLNKYQLPDYPPKSTGSNVTTSKKPCRIKFARGSTKHDTNFSGHIDNILCVAASSDGKFVATGGRDNRLVIWSAADLTVLKVFHQHRAAVTGLVFRRGTNQLYSSSADRTVKLWSLDELAYIDTLFGHQDEILAISALSAERCVTVGARDRTARLWKIVDETQLVFRGSQPGDKPRKFNKDGSLRYEEGSMDCVAMIDEEHFVTGSDNGALALWSLHKKKPLHITPPAHGLADPPKPEQSSAELNPPQEPPCPPQPRAITALVAIPYSDLVFSGSYDGSVRAWKISEDKKMIEPLGAVGKEGGIRGVVNGLSVVERGEEFPKKSKRRNDGVEGAEEVDKGPRQIVIAVGTATEMRLGRWMHVEGRNGGYVLECTRGQFEDKSAEAQDDDEIMEE